MMAVDRSRLPAPGPPRAVPLPDDRARARWPTASTCASCRTTRCRSCRLPPSCAAGRRPIRSTRAGPGGVHRRPARRRRRRSRRRPAWPTCWRASAPRSTSRCGPTPPSSRSRRWRATPTARWRCSPICWSARGLPTPTSSACAACGSIGCGRCARRPRRSPIARSRARIYGAHPYGHPGIGTPPRVRAMTADEIRALPRRAVHAVGDDAGGRPAIIDPTRRTAGRRRRSATGAVRRRPPPPDCSTPPPPALGAAACCWCRGPARRNRSCASARCRRRARHARLPRAAAVERRARRPVREPAQPEPAPGEGLHLRRALGLRLPARPRAVQRADQRADRGHGRRRRRSAARDRRACAGARPVTADELARAKAAVGLRLSARLRDRAAGGARRGAAGPARPAAPITSSSSCRALDAVHLDDAAARPRTVTCSPTR